MQRCKNHSADNHIGSSNINTNYEGLFMDSDIEVAKNIMSSAGTKLNLPAQNLLTNTTKTNVALLSDSKH